MGRAVGCWVSPSEHIQEEDEDTGQDRQTSEVMKDRLLVDGGGLTDKSTKGRKEGQVGRQWVLTQPLVLKEQERGKERKADGDQMVRKCCGYIPHQLIQ